MTETIPTNREFTDLAGSDRLNAVAQALRSRGFEVQLVDTVASARKLLRESLPTDRTIFTTASETLRLSGIDDDINASGRYRAIRPELAKLDFHKDPDERRRLTAAPDIAIGSVQAVTEQGQLAFASASGSQIGAFSAAAQTIWIVGAQKIVPDLDAAFRRIYHYCLPLEDARARETYGQPSAVAKLLIVERELRPGRASVILIEEAIGF